MDLDDKLKRIGHSLNIFSGRLRLCHDLSMKKTKRRFRNVAQYLLLCMVVAETTVVAQRAKRSPAVEEMTIAQIHAAMRAWGHSSSSVSSNSSGLA